MRTIVSGIFWLPCLGLVLSCGGTKFKEPFCKDTIKEFPAKYWGKFEGALPQPQNEFNGALGIKKTTITIVKNGILLPADGKMIVPIQRLGKTNICAIGDLLYLEQLEGDSTYRIQRMDVSSEGLHVSSLIHDPLHLKGLGWNFIVPPQINIVVSENPSDIEWRSDFQFMPNELILDNHGLSAQELLQNGSFSAIQINYNKIQENNVSVSSMKKMTLADYLKLRISP